MIHHQIEPHRHRVRPASVTVVLFVVLLASCSAPQRITAIETPGVQNEAIEKVLRQQEQAWNEGNILKFMAGYWQSDELMFVGKEITRGWQATLDRYQTTYPTREAMGTLNFEFYSFKHVSIDHCVVTGRYTLQRLPDNPTGLFTLLMKNIGGQWVIVYDHTP